jgi:hypothetical protein
MPAGFLFVQLVFAAVPIGALAFFGWLGLRFVRARERESAARLGTARPEELARIQDALLSLQTEVHALRERQEFVERLLERPR